MGIDERLGWLLLGCGIGFILGYIVRSLAEIKEELDEVDEIVKHQRIKDERGVFTRRLTANLTVFVLVCLTLFAAFQSQVASNKSNDTSDRIIKLQKAEKKDVDCLKTIMFQSVQASNERTRYSGSQIDANIDLVQAQLDLITRSQDPSLTEEQVQALFRTYVKQVQNFIKVATETKNQQLQYPFPTVEELSSCLNK